MIAGLAAAFPGKLDRFAKMISLTDRRAISVSCADLLDPGVLTGMIEGLSPRYPDARHYDLAVIWSRIYCARIIGTTLFPGLLLGRRLPVELADVRFVVEPETGYPVSFQFADAGGLFDTIDPFERFAPLIRNHVASVIEAVAEYGKAPNKILWGDTAVAIDSFIRRAQTVAAEREQTLEGDPITLIEATHWPDGWKNPLHQPFFPSECCDGRRVRKTCCLYYRLNPGNRFCGACPITEKQMKRRAACVTEAA